MAGGSRGRASSSVPVTVFTGFLGAGKTSLINHILSEKHGKRIAIIENEFGEVSVDDGLVVTANEEIIEVMNGCLCCTVRGDLVVTLKDLLKRKEKFDYILIETTGLADPAPVAQTFFVDEDLSRQLVLDAIITVADAKHLEQHLDDEKPEGVENESVEQVAFADVIVLNKVDLVDEEKKKGVISRIKAINATAKIIETNHCKLDVASVLDVQGFKLEKVLEIDPNFLKEEGAEHLHDTSVTSVGLEVEGKCDWGRVNDWLSELLTEKGNDIFRCKGILAVDGTDDKFFFQGVHMLLAFGSSAGGGVDPWAPGERRANRLIFIGRNLDREALKKSFMACIVKKRRGKASA